MVTDMVTDMSQNFTVLIRVRYAECDAQGVVFNGRYGDYVDVVATEYLRALFGGYQQMLDGGLDSQVVRLATNWKSSARFDDILAIHANTVHVGDSSYSFSMEFSDYATGRLVASSEIVYVMVQPDMQSKMTIPDHFRAALTRVLEETVVDLAAVDL